MLTQLKGLSLVGRLESSFILPLKVAEEEKEVKVEKERDKQGDTRKLQK